MTGSKPLTPKENGWSEVMVEPSLPQEGVALRDPEENRVGPVVHFSLCLYLFSGSLFVSPFLFQRRHCSFISFFSKPTLDGLE